MISYQELVSALTEWRAQQGLPPIHVEQALGRQRPQSIADIGYGHENVQTENATHDSDEVGVEYVESDDIGVEPVDVNSNHIIPAPYDGSTDDIDTPNYHAEETQVATDQVLTPDLSAADAVEPSNPFSVETKPGIVPDDDSDSETNMAEESHPLFSNEEQTAIVDDPVAYDSSVDDDDDDYYDAIAADEAPIPPSDHTLDGIAVANVDQALSGEHESPFEEPEPPQENDVLTSAEESLADDEELDGEATRVGGLAGYDIDELE